VQRFDAIWHLADLTRAEAFESISKKEQELFIGILERVHANLSALVDAPIEDNAGDCYESTDSGGR